MLEGLRGLRVVSFESRRSAEMAELIRNYGGEPIQAPSMREVPLSDQHAIVADQRRHNRAVLLLDVRAVVLAVGPTAREGDAFVETGVVQRAIDELGALAPDGLQLEPARGHVDGAQRVQEEAAAVLATMRDEIDLQKAGPGVVHCANVRMGICCLSHPPGRVVLRPRRGTR